MSTTPINNFIPRSIPAETKELLEKFSSWIDEIVNFGSNLICWDLENQIGEDEVLPPILFLRNYLA